MDTEKKILIRDAFLLALLIAIILYGAKKRRIAQVNSYRQRIASQPFTAHEIDEKFLAKIDLAIKHAQDTFPQAPNKPLSHETMDQLKIIEKKLTTLREKYTHTSPAMALLGPIGTTAIVLKESEIEKQLQKICDELASIEAQAK